MELLNWLEEWYSSACNKTWEEYYGIKIATMDNPGWLVEIDILETGMESKSFPPFKIDNGDDDWISCEVVNGKFVGVGDKTKLSSIVDIFRGWVEESNMTR